jgi:poly(3-hydroxybutyrate) depolymerase
MNRCICLILTLAALPLAAHADNWPPAKDVAGAKGLALSGRALDLYRHGIKAEWGYAVPQQDTFVVIHPRTARKQAPLYVVLHSAGHNVISCVKCTATAGNHDIYHSPDDFYALYLDCRANRGDWWWGGMHARDKKLTERNSGGDPMPVERRAIDTVKWVMQTYAIDPNRVYLCGNSMGGSGALGIGLRNGDLFAAVKANVPAGIEHAAQRMYFPPRSVPDTLTLPDPPVLIDYSAPNDGWSTGHDRFVKAMNDRKYPLYFYWGPFGHANNHAKIMQVNDLINSFDWLAVKKNEAYAVFTNASTNHPLPWPDKRQEKAPGQVNAFFRWKVIRDTKEQLEIALFLVSPAHLNTRFTIPPEARADVSLRRIQHLRVEPGDTVNWSFGSAKGTAKADAEGLITLPGLTITAASKRLSIRPGTQ